MKRVLAMLCLATMVAAGAAAVEVAEDLEGVLDDLVRLAALDIHDEADATGVVLMCGVIEALGLRRAGGRRELGQCHRALALIPWLHK